MDMTSQELGILVEVLSKNYKFSIRSMFLALYCRFVIEKYLFVNLSRQIYSALSPHPQPKKKEKKIYNKSDEFELIFTPKLPFNHFFVYHQLWPIKCVNVIIWEISGNKAELVAVIKI